MMRYGVAKGSKVYHRVGGYASRDGFWPACFYSVWHNNLRGIVTEKVPVNKRPCKRCYREKKA